MVRESLALVAGAAVAVIAAAVLGEYGFDGWATIGAGVLTGLFVAEAALAVARKGSRLLAGGAAVLAGAALAWAGWISTGHRLGTATWKGWTAIVLAAAAGGLRARPTSAARGSRPAPAATE
jgi:ABC-type cobalamin transport system permease subunit